MTKNEKFNHDTLEMKRTRSFNDFVFVVVVVVVNCSLSCRNTQICCFLDRFISFENCVICRRNMSAHNPGKKLSSSSSSTSCHCEKKDDYSTTTVGRRVFDDFPDTMCLFLRIDFGNGTRLLFLTDKTGRRLFFDFKQLLFFFFFILNIIERICGVGRDNNFFVDFLFPFLLTEHFFCTTEEREHVDEQETAGATATAATGADAEPFDDEGNENDLTAMSLRPGLFFVKQTQATRGRLMVDSFEEIGVFLHLFLFVCFTSTILSISNANADFINLAYFRAADDC